MALGLVRYYSLNTPVSFRLNDIDRLDIFVTLQLKVLIRSKRYLSSCILRSHSTWESMHSGSRVSTSTSGLDLRATLPHTFHVISRQRVRQGIT